MNLPKDVVAALDRTDEYQVTHSEFVIGNTLHLLVTLTGEIDGGQYLFERTPEGWSLLDADNIIDPVTRSSNRNFTAEVSCQAASSISQREVHEFSVDQVGTFSSASGPDGGNLACVWAVRHLIKNALGYWVTRTDGTAVFDPELRRCFGGTHQEADVEAGGIIISPTEGSSPNRNVGHVGLLGEKTGDGSRKIYSNSSGAAVWKQNFTLDSWIARYRDRKGLKIRFYPIPYRGQPLSL